MARRSKRNPNDALEGMIDRSSLSNVVGDLSEICYLKAQHIEESWQDTALAKVWERAGRRLGTASAAIRKMRI